MLRVRRGADDSTWKEPGANGYYQTIGVRSPPSALRRTLEQGLVPTGEIDWEQSEWYETDARGLPRYLGRRVRLKKHDPFWYRGRRIFLCPFAGADEESDV